MTNYIRVDDRLIHGQIIANWASYLNVKNIVGIDEKTAKNPALQSIMKMSVPKNYLCYICTMKDSIEVIKELSATDQSNFIIVRFPHLLEELLDNIKDVKSVNIGNVSKKEGKSYEISNNVYFTEEDLDVVDRLFNKGVNLTFKTLPDSQGLNWGKERTKYGKQSKIRSF